MKVASKMKYKWSDTVVMSKRSLVHTSRNFDAFITTLVLPIIMMLLFVYVFGGAIDTGSVDYINYVVPGITLLCIGYTASTTAVSINNDMTKGIIDRFRSMPIAKSSLLTGHVFASVVRNVLTTTLVMSVAFLMGFQTNATVVEWLLVVGIFLLYTLAMTWLSVVFGLLANSAEGAGAFSFFVLFLPYLSSAFVPTETMPNVVRVFAENQPMTPINETIRAFLMDTPVGNNAVIAIFWCVSIIFLSYLFSLFIYKRKTV